MLQSVTRRVAHAAGARIEAYRVFTDASVRSGAEDQRVRRSPGMHRQFVLPIAFHKRINSESATRRIESAMSRVGLNGLFGSPVTLVAERCAS